MAVWSLLLQDDSEGPTFIFCTAHALQRFLTQAVRFIFGVAPIDYSPVLLLMPFGFHLAMDTLPSGELQVLGFRSALACVRLSLSCPFKLLHTFHLPRPTRHYPRLRIQRSSFERRRDFNPPEQRAAQRTLRSDPTPPARTCLQYGIKPFQTGLSVRQARWRSPGSRACCFSACAGSQTTQGRLAARDSATSRVAFPAGETVGVPGSKPFRSSIARPTDTLVYASTHTSRCQSQDSGSRWTSLSPSCRALSSPTTCRLFRNHYPSSSNICVNAW